MKKTLCLALSLVLSVCCFSAFAEAEIPETEEINMVVVTPDGSSDFSEIVNKLGTDTITAPERPAEVDSFSKDASAGGDEDVSKAVTADTVTINGNSYTVQLPGVMTFHYTAPSNVLVLTQDVAQQSALFASLYQNPKQAADNFINNSMHLNLYDTNTGADLFLFVYRTDVASVYTNSNNLTVDEAEYLIKYFFSLDSYFGKCPEATYGYAGGNVWLIGDATSTLQKVFFVAFVNGFEVWGELMSANPDRYNAAIDMLNTLIID